MERTATGTGGWRMTNSEHLEALCSIIRQQAAIIREQGVFIDEQLTVDEALRKYFAEQREEVSERIAQLDGALPPLPDRPAERRTT